MTVENTLSALSNFCKASSGDPQVWIGNKSTYHWNRGKTTATGLLNGVVRKKVGDEWTLAGSFKIAADGTILRFTGLGKKVQKNIQSIAVNSEVDDREAA